MNAQDKENKLSHAYHEMVSRVRSMLGRENAKAEPEVYQGIEKAKQEAIKLGELSQEEADRLGEYLRRDLEDAAKYLADTGKALSDWLMLDLELIEEQLLDAFSQVADKTRLELAFWAEQARHAQDYHAGEVAGIGTIACLGCGECLYFHKAGQIPPCPKCGHAVFTRAKERSQAAVSAPTTPPK